MNGFTDVKRYFALGSFLNDRDNTIKADVLIFTNDNDIVANGFGGEELV